MVKKIVSAIGIVSLLCLVVLAVNYISNKNFIKDYNKGVYENSQVNQVLGVTQPYVYHYNQGNVYYNKGDYQGAELEYREALEHRLKDDKDCMVRINLALSIVKQIDVSSVNEQNLDDIIARLEEAKEILIENGCAHKNDEDGHNKDAQTLKDEIDAFEEMLKNTTESQKQDDKSDQQGQDDSDDQDEENQDLQESQEEEIKKKLQEIQDDGLKQRNSEMDTYESYKDGMDFYYGQTW